MFVAVSLKSDDIARYTGRGLRDFTSENRSSRRVRTPLKRHIEAETEVLKSVLPVASYGALWWLISLALTRVPIPREDKPSTERTLTESR